MPGHGQNSGRRFASLIMPGLFAFAATSGLAAWEAVRIAEARATVASGWAAGVAAGAGTGLVLAALVIAPILVRRQRSWTGGKLGGALIITITMLVVVTFFTSLPPRQYVPNPVPYVITTGIGVAEIACLSTVFAGLALVSVAWIMAKALEPNPFLDD
jgi:hypothetical protein